MIRKMSVALINDAEQNGTLSWDVTLSRVLSLVLQATVAGRSGDVARSRQYYGQEFLQYGHITIKLVSKNDSERLVAILDLKNCKGFK